MRWRGLFRGSEFLNGFVEGIAALTEGPAHGDDVALKVAGHDVPHTLIQDKGRLPSHLRVRVGLRDNPRRRVRYTLCNVKICIQFSLPLSVLVKWLTYEVQDLPLRNKVMETVHYLLNGGIEVPPVHVKDINVIRAQFLQARVDGNVHGLEVVPDVVCFDPDVVLTAFKVRCVL